MLADKDDEDIANTGNCVQIRKRIAVSNSKH